jgi:tRNA (guanine37-N1)-methyltransferase
MVMQAQPIYDCFRSIVDRIEGSYRCIYLTPQGKTFNQPMAKKLVTEENLIFLCGHYEGVDERVLEEIVDENISLGDFVLTGGELPAIVMVDAIARLIPGVLHNDDSAFTESFENGLLEYPQYSRPEEWHGKKVPEILLSGDHKKVDEWRLSQSIERTKRLRPDLLKDNENF